MTNNANSPAYPAQYMDFQPHSGEQVVREQWPGLTKREYFAGLCLQGIIASGAGLQEECKMLAAKDLRKLQALAACFMADALLAELSQPAPSEHQKETDGPQ